jgi:hypothetical protein
MEDFALRQKPSPRAIHRRLLGLWSPFNNSSTVIFNPSATLVNVSRRSQRFPVSRNPIPVRLNPERCANSFLAYTSVEMQFLDSGGKRVESPIGMHFRECAGSIYSRPPTVVCHTIKGIPVLDRSQRDALVLVTRTRPWPPCTTGRSLR